MASIDCSQFPAQQIAIKACLEALACVLDGNPVGALQAQLSFAAKAGVSVGVQIDAHNACFLAAIGFMFAAANKVMPPLPALPTIPDIGSTLPTIPSIPSIPSTPGISITFGSDGVTPVKIDF